MHLEIRNPPQLYDPTAHGYSHAIIVRAQTGFAFISGQGGFRGDGSLPPDFGAQTDAALVNLDHAIRGVGAVPGDICKLTVLVVGHDEARLSVLNARLVPFFDGLPRAQTLIPVPRLAIDGMLIEIDATVALGNRRADTHTPDVTFPARRSSDQ